MTNLDELTQAILAARSDDDSHPLWPTDTLEAYAAFGGWRWGVPEAFGGTALSALEQVQIYEAVARGDLSTALIITQRDGACDLLNRGHNEPLKREWLSAMALGERFASIGIAQLTTSRGPGGKPHLVAMRDGMDWILDGAMPWVSGAPGCDAIVAGAVCDPKAGPRADDPPPGQLLALVDVSEPGVTVEAPLQLVAVNPSCTSRVRCERVRIPASRIIRGPQADALQRRAPVKSLVVIAAGLGAAGALLEQVTSSNSGRGPVFEMHVESVTDDFNRLRDEIYGYAKQLGAEEVEIPKTDLRARVNSLGVRLAILSTTLGQGRGFVLGHPAQRLMRETMFFLVWSAPEDVQLRTLDELYRGPAA